MLDLLQDVSLSNIDVKSDAGTQMKLAFGHLMQQVTAAIRDQPFSAAPQHLRQYVPAIIPSGAGVAPMPDVQEALGPDATGATHGPLLWDTIFVTGQNCESRLPNHIPRTYQIIVMQRGGCSFTQKLQNIPSFAPSKNSLQLVIVVSYKDEDGWLTRPLLDVPQYTSSGIPRHNPIPMVMVGGGEEVYGAFQRAVGIGIKRRYSVQAQGVPISNLIII